MTRLLIIELVQFQQLFFTHVYLDWEKWPGQFRFVIVPAFDGFLDPSTIPTGGLAAGQSYRSPLQIAWVGVEPVVGCRVGEAEILGQAVRCCRPAESPPRFRPLAAGRAR